MNLPSLIAERMAEERKRLYPSQAAAATACGVSREMWGKYERGVAMVGGDVLFLFASCGADVNYIFTGQRPVQHEAISMDEEMLLDAYRGLDAVAKKRLLAAVLTGEAVAATQINHNTGIAGGIGVVNVDNKRR